MACQNQRLRAGAALDKASLDKQLIHAQLRFSGPFEGGRFGTG
jgi:hypothetical protein